MSYGRNNAVQTPAVVQYYCVGRNCKLLGRPAHFATSAYRQPLPTFPRTLSAKITGRCTTDSQSSSC
jgi:hypothetical protein